MIVAKPDTKTWQRFWDKVDLNGPLSDPELGPCWEWTGYLVANQTYGQFWFGYRYYPAHRVSYTWCVGEIPDGLILHHLCHYKPCVNPMHLKPMTQQENCQIERRVA